MLDSLKEKFKKEFQFSHIVGVLQQVNNLVSIFQTQFMKDECAKNEAIDLVCSLLQGHKEVPCDNVKEGCNATG